MDSMDLIHPEDRQPLIRAWKNFDRLVSTLPLSDMSALLAFYCRHVLEKLMEPSVERSSLGMMTQRVKALVQTSPVLLDADDLLVAIHQALYGHQQPLTAVMIHPDS